MSSSASEAEKETLIAAHRPLPFWMRVRMFFAHGTTTIDHFHADRWATISRVAQKLGAELGYEGIHGLDLENCADEIIQELREARAARS